MAIRTLLAWILSTLAGEYEHTRRIWRCRRDGHAMHPMSDGPVCGRCGSAWIWTD